jgi:hypothetical protein
MWVSRPPHQQNSAYLLLITPAMWARLSEKLLIRSISVFQKEEKLFLIMMVLLDYY